MATNRASATAAPVDDITNEMLSRGFLPLFTLHLLHERPRHGNDLIRAIAERSRGMWQPSSSGVYAVLRKLERNGWISGEWEHGATRTKRTYTVTASGLVELAARRSSVHDQSERARRAIGLVVADLTREDAGP